jgi:hypothetical protein
MARGYRTREQQRELVERWRGSGTTRAAFCARVGISPATFTRWLARAPAPMTFAEVVPPRSSHVAPRPPEGAPAPVVVVLPGGTRLVVEAGASMALVAELARVLG